jgi:malonate decarboxylase delta subunit
VEALYYDYRGGTAPHSTMSCVLVGVLGSGNLEVLVESAPHLSGRFTVEIVTVAAGFGRIWQAVLDDVFARWPLADVRVCINDCGATPAVVALRIDQALEEFTTDRRGMV